MVESITPTSSIYKEDEISSSTPSLSIKKKKGNWKKLTMKLNNKNDEEDQEIIPQQMDQLTITPPSTPNRFIFNKPAYDDHYHKTHYHHLQRHTSLFKDFKQLFKKTPLNHLLHLQHQQQQPKSSLESVALSPSVSDYSFGNEFNKDLESKYGTWGSFVGKGAGGSVRVIYRATDQKKFAVKQFRKRNEKKESEKKYIKNVTAEFCIGSALHHENIIETLDMIQEHGIFYEIMEYCPMDLFQMVTLSTLTHPQINCYWRQFLNGVNYLQSMGIGHRDLKLENVVINEMGILKIIDFGMATIVQLPGSSTVKLSSGVCGSDPYIAPEILLQNKYHSFLSDNWSCGIIYACMMIHKFPWRLAHEQQDENYQLYRHDKNALLSYIPRYARTVLAHLLEPQPNHRWSMSELLENKWVASIDHCTLKNHCLSHHQYYKNKEDLY
ncbi:kinase-like domain-containing protein [Cunninghamella echinulata]|nr:kinase-like domain-containing protein [Cunninghamella echinulata]